MAVSAEQILFFSIPEAGSFAVDADFPVAEFVAVALATKPVRFGERYDLSRNQTQSVPVAEIVTVKAPTLPLGMIENYVFVHVNKFSSFRIRFHVCMAVGTGKDIFGKGRWWHSVG